MNKQLAQGEWETWGRTIDTFDAEEDNPRIAAMIGTLNNRASVVGLKSNDYKTAAGLGAAIDAMMSSKDNQFAQHHSLAFFWDGHLITVDDQHGDRTPINARHENHMKVALEKEFVVGALVFVLERNYQDKLRADAVDIAENIFNELLKTHPELKGVDCVA